MRKQRRCPECGSDYGRCPECGTKYYHGTESQCTKPACIKVNAPIDCLCGYVVCDDLSGVLDFDMNLLEWD